MHVVKAAASSKHSKVPASVEVKVKVAVALLLSAAGLEVIVVSGGVASSTWKELVTCGAAL